ncbi:hypothetical protein STEG23_008993 [Scotinomys teguina]
MSLLQFGARRLLFTSQLLWLLTLAVPIPAFAGNPVQLTSEPWVPTRLWSWHPSDHPPKSPHTRAPKTDTGGTESLGSSAPTEVLAPLEELTDSLLPFQDPGTSREPNPEPEELYVSHQDLTNKLVPPGKRPKNILMLKGDQTVPSQLRSTPSLTEATDHQLYEMIVPPLDSQSSKAMKFTVSPKELKKGLTQHKKLAKAVVGKPQTITDDYYEDLNMNETYSYSLPLQSQERADEAPELLEQAEPDQLETQVRNPENLLQDTPDDFPQPPKEDETSIPKEDAAHHHLPSEEPPVHPEINGPPPNGNEGQHSNLLNVSVKPDDLKTVTPEADTEAHAALSQPQTLEQFPVESPELLVPPSTQQEAPDEILELPEDLESSGSQLEALSPSTKLPEEISLVEQEATVPVPESAMQSEVETPLTTALPPSQDQVLHYTLPTVTDKPIDVAVTITSEPEKEIESSPYEEETPTQTPGPLVADEASGDPEEVESSGVDLESSVPPQEDAGEVRPLPPQQEDLSQHLGPVLEEESSPNEIEQPAQLSEFPEEVGSGSGNQPEASVQPAELPPVEQEAPLQTPESPNESVVETSPVPQVQPGQSEEHHYQLSDRPVDVALTITSEPTKETESSLAQSESLAHPLETTDGMEPFLNEEEPPAQASEPPGESQFQSQLEVPTQALEYAEEFTPSTTDQEQAVKFPEHPTTPTEDQYSLVGQGVPTQPEELSEKPSPSQQGSSAWPSTTDTFFSPADLEAIFRTEHPKSYKTIKHVGSASIQTLDLELAINLQPTTNEKLSQTIQETTNQMMGPPKEVVAQGPEYHEISILTAPQIQANYLASPTVSFQSLNLELTISSEPTRKPHPPTTPPNTIIAHPPKHPLVIHPEHVHTQQSNPTEATVQPLDLELATTSEPTRETHHPTTPKQTIRVHTPKHPLVIHPGHAHVQHQKPAQVTVQPLDLERTVSHLTAAKGELSQTVQASTTHLLEPPREVVSPVPAHQEATVPTPGQAQAEVATCLVSFQPLDLEFTVSSKLTRETHHPVISKKTVRVHPPKHPQVIHPEQVHIQHPNPAEVTVQPLDLELTIAPQLTGEGELSQSMQESATQITERPRQVVVAEYTVSPSVTLQPLDLELTITSEPPRESHHPTTLEETTVPPSEYPLVIHSEPIHNKHSNPPKVTVQPLKALKLTVTHPPTNEGEVSQSMQESTTQITKPPREGIALVPEFQEVTVPIPIQGQAKYPTPARISFQSLDQERIISAEPPRGTHYPPAPAPEQTTVHSQKVLLNPELFVPFTRALTEVTVEPDDYIPSPVGNITEPLQRTTAKVRNPPKKVVAQTLGYKKGEVSALIKDQAQYLTLPYQPLDMEPVTSEPTREARHPATLNENIVHFPINSQVTLLEQDHIQHPHATEIPVHPLDLEAAITHQPTTKEGLFETLQKAFSQPAQLHEGLGKAPVFDISKDAMPGHQIQHTMSPEGPVKVPDVEHATTELFKIEGELSEAPENITIPPPNNPEEVLPPPDKIQVQPPDITQYLHSEFSVTRQPNTMVKRSARMKYIPAQTSEIPVETVAQSLEHYEITPLTSVPVEAQHSYSSALDPEHSEVAESARPEVPGTTVYLESSHSEVPDTVFYPESAHSEVPTTTAASTEAADWEVSVTTAASIEIVHSGVPATTAAPTEAADSGVPTTIAVSVEIVDSGVPTTTSVAPTEAADSGVPATTAPTPKFPEMTTLPPDQAEKQYSSPAEVTVTFLKRKLITTPYSEKSNTELDLTMEQNMYTDICDFCLCENKTLLCIHLSPLRRLHQVPVPRPNTYNDTFAIL